MERDMKRLFQEWIDAPVKRALPILSFPAAQLMNISVRELIGSSENQARGMELVAARTDAAASVSLMDLSVEAECFGSAIRVSDGEVPTVVGHIVESEEEAEALAIPPVGAGRTGICVEAVRKATERITDRPVFAGAAGPFSLAARLLEVTEIMVDCYDEPDMVHMIMEKTTAFLIAYCLAFKEAGANGVVLAEPVTGLLSPNLAAEFSAPYVKRLVDAVQDERFAVIYHNCGNYVTAMLDSILETGAAAFHFGNSIDMADVLPRVPAHIPVMGNVDPAGVLRNGTPESVREATLDLLGRCHGWPNFIVSSGCDIPPLTPWANIDAFFQAARDFYQAG